MATRLTLIDIENTALSRRNIICHPPEPPAHVLFKDPTKTIYLGRTEFLNVPVYWDFRQITNPHIAIVGITGSGKSYLIKTFLLRASFVWKSNAIIIDWAGEYRDWVMETGGKIISLGKGNYINLLDLGGMKPYDRIKQVIRSLEILTDLGQYPEQKRLTEEAIEEAYKKAKFKMDSVEQKDELGRPLEPPTLKDVLRILEEKEQLGNYPFPAELKNAIFRLKKFTRGGEDFFSNKSTIPLDKLFTSGLVDIDLSGLPSEELRALGALTILQFIKERMRREGWAREKGIKLITVLDEAWKISKHEYSDAVMIIREGRKYNFSLIVASQNPTDINEAIFSNVGTTIILKTKFEQYLDYLQKTLNFSDYMRERITYFGVGQAAINIAFNTPEKYPQTFIIKKIDGEEPFKDYFLDLSSVIKKGDFMARTISFRKNIFREKMRALGLSEEKLEILTRFFDRNNRHVDVVSFVSMLERYGVNRKAISNFLKQFGVDDSTIINIFSKADFKKEGKNREVSQLILEDDEDED